jgi:hypothetical protein
MALATAAGGRCRQGQVTLAHMMVVSYDVQHRSTVLQQQLRIQATYYCVQALLFF